MQGYILSVHKQKNEDVIVRILAQHQILTLYRFYGARHPIIHIGHKIDFTQEYNGTFMPRLRNVMHLGFVWERDMSRRYVWQRFIQILHQHLRDISTIEEQYFSILDSSAQHLSTQNPKRVVLEAYAQILRLEGRISPLRHCVICDQPLEREPNHSILESLELGYLINNDTQASLQALQEWRASQLHAKTQQKNWLDSSGANDCSNANNASGVPIAPSSSCMRADALDSTMNVAVLRGFLCAHMLCAQAQTLPYAKLESYLSTASTIALDNAELERAYQVLLLGM